MFGPAGGVEVQLRGEPGELRPSPATYPSGACHDVAWFQVPFGFRQWYISFDACGEPVLNRST